MNISALFIKRPITTTLITIGIVVFGVMSYRVLPVADLPAIDFPTISVNASLPGASPETMASAVALPLEKQFSTISGLTSMNSNNTAGHHQHHAAIRLEPRHRRRRAGRADDDCQGDTSAAAADAVAAVVHEGESRRLSRHAARHAVATLPLSTVNEYAESNVSQRISMVNGVAQVQRIRTAEIRRPHRRRSAEALGARHRHRRGRHRGAIVERQPADRHDGRPRSDLHGARRRPALECGVIRPDGDRVQERQPRAARRRGARLRRRRAGQDRQLVSGHAEHQPDDPEAARIERRAGGR